MFVAGPIVWSVWAAFTNAALTGAAAANTEFVGFENFQNLLADPAVWNATVLTLIFLFGSAIVGQNLLGLALALLMQRRNRVTRAFVSTVVVGAWVLPETVTAFTWAAFLGREGSLNTALAALGLPPQNWMYAAPIFAVILANIWKGTAFSMMVYSAALQEVPPDLKESARVDGASGVQTLRHVTLPLIRRSILTNLILITLQTLQVFTLIYIMTGGGPGTRSETLPVLMYEQAFDFGHLGYGTAIALVLLAVAGLVSAVYVRALRAEGSV
nr:sugar ABC transporter permease [Allonocardiopsis opalescens]